jgi:hypothetical protein
MICVDKLNPRNHLTVYDVAKSISDITITVATK